MRYKRGAWGCGAGLVGSGEGIAEGAEHADDADDGRVSPRQINGINAVWHCPGLFLFTMPFFYTHVAPLVLKRRGWTAHGACLLPWAG